MTNIQPSNDKHIKLYQTQNLKHFTEICEQRTKSAWNSILSTVAKFEHTTSTTRLSPKTLKLH